MKLIKIGGLVMVGLMAVSAMAADVKGTWNGKMSMDFASLRGQLAKAKPDQRKMAESQMAMAENLFKTMVFKLELKAGGVAVFTSPEGPMGGKSKSETGTWTLSGNKLVVGGMSKKDKGPKELNGIVSANGKSIVFDMTAVAQKEAAKNPNAKGQKIPAMLLTFSKA
jgi:hypothetical protein